MRNTKLPNIAKLNQKGNVHSIVGMIVLCALISALLTAAVYNFHAARSRSVFATCMDTLVGVKNGIELTAQEFDSVGGANYILAEDPTRLCKNLVGKEVCDKADIEAFVRTNCKGQDGTSDWSFTTDIQWDGTDHMWYKVMGAGNDYKKCTICVTNSGALPSMYKDCATTSPPVCP